VEEPFSSSYAIAMPTRCELESERLVELAVGLVMGLEGYLVSVEALEREIRVCIVLLNISRVVMYCFVDGLLNC